MKAIILDMHTMDTTHYSTSTIRHVLDDDDDVISIAPYQGTVPICGHADIEERQR